MDKPKPEESEPTETKEANTNISSIEPTIRQDLAKLSSFNLPVPQSPFVQQTVQDGFQELFTFTGHRLQLRGFTPVDWSDELSRPNKFGPGMNYYLSWDVKQVLLWGHDYRQGMNASSLVDGNLYQPILSIPPGTTASGTASLPNTPRPFLITQLKFSNMPNFICAMAHISKMRIFLAAALDMSFKLYDQNLTLVESIHHEERAILQIEYDSVKEIIFTSGATGVSVWRLYRASSSVATTGANTSGNKAHVMEKLYSFPGCEMWISKMIYQPEYQKIYAIKDSSVQVLSPLRRCVIAVLENIHEAPINVVCWYERNQFYITGCSRGEIKCWTSNYTKSRNSGGTSISVGTGGGSTQKTFALLHTFKGHSRAVTSLFLHPVSGLAVSAGLDGYVKVFNLEALNELYSINVGAGVIHAKLIQLGSAVPSQFAKEIGKTKTSVKSSMSQYGCLLALTDASVKFWKLTSISAFFSVSTSSISNMVSYGNIESYLENVYNSEKKMNAEILASRFSNQNQNLLLNKSSHEGKLNEMFDERSRQVNTREILQPIPETTNEINNVFENDFSHPLDPNELISMNYPKGDANEKYIVTSSTQDVRVFQKDGSLLGRLEPEFVVEGIRSISVSIYQKLLICLCEGDKIRVHCMRKFNFPLIKEYSLKSTILSNKKAMYRKKDVSLALDDEDSNDLEIEEISDLGTCCTIADIAPTNSLLVARNDQNEEDKFEKKEEEEKTEKFDLRGEKLPSYIECYLYVGLSNGALMVLDMLRDFQVVFNFQANNGPIRKLEYIPGYSRLYMLGEDSSSISNFNVKIWSMPNFQLVGQVRDLMNVSTFSSSIKYNSFCVGFSDGTVKLYRVLEKGPNARGFFKGGGIGLGDWVELDDMKKKSKNKRNLRRKNIIADADDGSSISINDMVQEIVNPSDNHDSKITYICFSDNNPVFSTCCAEGKIKMWTLDKVLLRVFKLTLPPTGIVVNECSKGLLMAQNNYILMIPKHIWDNEDILNEWSDNYFDEMKKKRIKQLMMASTKDSIENSLDIDKNSPDSQTQDENSAEKKIVDLVSDNILTQLSSTPKKKNSHVEKRFSRKLSRFSDTSKRNSFFSSGANSKRSSIVGDMDNGGISFEESIKQAVKNFEIAMAAPSSSEVFEEVKVKEEIKKDLSELAAEQIQKDIILPFLAKRQFQIVSRDQEQGVDCFGHYSVVDLPEGSYVSSVSEKYNPGASIELELKRQEISTILMQDSGKKSLIPAPPNTNVRVKPPVQATAPSRIALAKLKLKSRFNSPPQETFVPAISSQNTSIATSAATNASYAEQCNIALNNSVTINTLRPKFLVYKRPPARMMKMEEVEEHMNSFSKQKVEGSNVPNVPTPPTNHMLTLSPRARLTLLNNNANNNNTSLDLDASKDIAIQTRTQEKVIFGLSLDMNLSENFKEVREDINKKRFQRSHIFSNKIKTLETNPSEDQENEDDQSEILLDQSETEKVVEEIVPSEIIINQENIQTMENKSIEARSRRAQLNLSFNSLNLIKKTIS